jgi:uncharacterized OB-fold protein
MSDVRQSRPPQPAVEDLTFVDAAWNLRQSYRADPLLAPFFEGLRNRRLLGVRDPGAGRVLFPPRSLSEESFAQLQELVPVGPGGVIRTLTRVPGGKGGRPPLTVVFVQLDGADAAAAGHLRGAGADTDDLLALVGRRCRAVFKDAPEGAWTDFWYELEG